MIGSARDIFHIKSAAVRQSAGDKLPAPKAEVSGTRKSTFARRSTDPEADTAKDMEAPAAPGPRRAAQRGRVFAAAFIV